jgi:hypothetical protein
MVFPGSRQLHLLGCLCALALAGCGSGHSSRGSSSATLYWYIFDIEDYAIGDYTRALPCADVGAAGVVVTLTNQATQEAYPQTVASCAAGGITTADVPAGEYIVSFDLYGDPAIYGNSTTLLDSFPAQGTFNLLPGPNDFTSEYAPFVVQSFVVSWAFNSGSALDICGLAGGAYVDFAFDAGAVMVTSPFYCTDGAGYSYAIPFDVAPTQWALYLTDSLGQDLQTLGGLSPALTATTNVYLPTQYFTY